MFDSAGWCHVWLDVICVRFIFVCPCLFRLRVGFAFVLLRAFADLVLRFNLFVACLFSLLCVFCFRLSCLACVLPLGAPLLRSRADLFGSVAGSQVGLLRPRRFRVSLLMCKVIHACVVRLLLFVVLCVFVRGLACSDHCSNCRFILSLLALLVSKVFARGLVCSDGCFVFVVLLMFARACLVWCHSQTGIALT